MYVKHQISILVNMKPNGDSYIDLTWAQLLILKLRSRIQVPHSSNISFPIVNDLDWLRTIH